MQFSTIISMLALTLAGVSVATPAPAAELDARQDSLCTVGRAGWGCYKTNAFRCDANGNRVETIYCSPCSIVNGAPKCN